VNKVQPWIEVEVSAGANNPGPRQPNACGCIYTCGIVLTSCLPSSTCP